MKKRIIHNNVPIFYLDGYYYPGTDTEVRCETLSQAREVIDNLQNKLRAISDAGWDHVAVSKKDLENFVSIHKN